MEDIFKISIPIDGPVDTDATGEVVEQLKYIYEQLLAFHKSPEIVFSQQCLEILLDKFNAKRLQMKDLRTSQLWLQYMDMVDILLKFLKAERTGNWDLHLQAITEMLPFLAVSGHNLYTKSVRIYLQDMRQLEKSQPRVHESFKAGLPVVRVCNMGASMCRDERVHAAINWNQVCHWRPAC